MNIKELFKEMEKANKFCEMIGDNTYSMTISLNGYSGKTYKTFKDFAKDLKEEWTKRYIDTLMVQNIEVDGHGCSDTHFVVHDAFIGKDHQSSIQLAIWNK